MWNSLYRRYRSFLALPRSEQRAWLTTWLLIGVFWLATASLCLSIVLLVLQQILPERYAAIIPISDQAALLVSVVAAAAFYGINTAAKRIRLEHARPGAAANINKSDI